MGEETNGYVKGQDRNQTFLLPEVLDEYVGEENEVRFIDGFVDSLNLLQLGFTHSQVNEDGRPPYDPADMLKLFIWGYLNQIRSSRKLERECHRNLEVIWLIKKLAPDFKTIADFRKDNVDCIKATFKEFVKLCMRLDMYGAKLVAIDGAKFKAVNSNGRNHNQETLQNRLKQMDEKVSRYLSEMEALDKEEKRGAKHADLFLTSRLEKLMKKKEEYAELLRGLKESNQKEVSLTDPECRLMKNRNTLEPCYNSHIAVDSKNHLIVDFDVTNTAPDYKQLSPMAKSAKETLGVEQIDAAADKGFFDAREIEECVANGVIPYVPKPNKYGVGLVKKIGIPTREFSGDRFVYDKSTDTYLCPEGKRLTFRFLVHEHGKNMKAYRTEACFMCSLFMTKCTTNKEGRSIERWEHEELIEEMRKRIRLGPEKLDARRNIVEHPFGTMKRAFNQGYLLLKGLRKVRGEVGFTMLAYNIRRAINLLGTGALISSIRV